MKITTKILTRSAVLLALALVVQLGKFPQPVTGPAINGILFIASAVVGPISGILIGLLTPIVAFAVGIMPFAPAMVIIMLGNATLAIVYGLLAKRQILALVAAAVGKFLVSQVFKLDLVMASVIILAIAAALMYQGVVALEKRLLKAF